MSRMFILSRLSDVNAVTATGTSCRVSSRLRAVTVTESSVVARLAGWPPSVPVSCANAQGADASSTVPIARLKCLRFMDIPSSRECVRRTVVADAGEG